MNYALNIREGNKQAHLDIEDEIKRKQDGLFTFILRVNDGRIVDCVIMQHIDARKYLTLQSITVTKFTVAPDNREGSTGDTIRSDNLQHSVSKGDSTTANT